MQSVMKLWLWIALIAGSSTASFAQADNWAGKWQGDLDGFPPVLLYISEADGAPQGTAQFNILERGDDGKTRVAGTMEAVLVNTREQGKDLQFQIIREERTGDSSDQTLVSFTLRRTGENSAKLVRLGGGDGSDVEMVRKGRE